MKIEGDAKIPLVQVGRTVLGNQEDPKEDKNWLILLEQKKILVVFF